MIAESIRDIFRDDCPTSSGEYEIAFRKVEAKGLFFRPARTVSLRILLLLKSDVIDFASITEDLRKVTETANGGFRRKLTCDWLVCSPRGGIYLYEAIATKENRTRGKLKNRFIVLNTGDGTVSFGPGHVNNMRYTRRMQDLIAAYRSIPPAAWNVAFAKLVDELFAVPR
jgi:hypothetical protein